ncbi:Gfo/Idh/MocA family protein [Oscillospiraceae bacterium LTW-04]|nr:Gfo/Idh/MocA family oxidoreductase [Oscillospiraceae bacterium MB24-C1]
MKFVVIGLGSMGKRRIRLLLKQFKPACLCGTDISEEKRAQVRALFGIATYANYETAIAWEHPDAALICTSPLSHGEIIRRCIARGLHIFSEINLVSEQYDAIIAAAKKQQVQLFLSSTQLYRKEIQTIADIVSKQGKPVNYRYHVGQYLLDWHPWENDKDFFVWDKRTDGCREIFAIELPWLIRTFGEIANFMVVKDKMSDLEIDYPDNYFLILQHEGGSKGVFIADVLTRKAQQTLLVYSDSLYLTWEGTPESLCRYDTTKKESESIATYDIVERKNGYTQNNIENAYEAELSAFLMMIAGEKDHVHYSFEEDLHTLKLIDRIEGMPS